MEKEGVPTFTQYIINTIKENETLGFDGKVVSANTILDLKNSLENKNIKFNGSLI